MGGKGLSMSELENLLSESGVVDPDLATNRIASNEHVRYLHVRDVKKAMDNDAKEQQKTVEMEQKQKLLEMVEKTEKMQEEDVDLQKAIQLSLGCLVTDDEQNEENHQETMNSSLESIVTLTVEQRKALGSAATSLARNFMLEYGGMNDDQIKDLVKLDESIKPTTEFKFNDDSILNNQKDSDTKSPLKQLKNNKPEQTTVDDKPIEISDTSSDEGVSSDADSDFIDVPDCESDVDHRFIAESKLPLPPPFLMNEPRTLNLANDFRLNDLTSNKKPIEVVIKPTEVQDSKDDIFADIFADTKDQKLSDKIDEKADNVTELPKIDKKIVDSTEKIQKSAASTTNDSLKNLLDDLDKEISTVTELKLDDLLNSKPKDSKDETKDFKGATKDVVDDILEKMVNDGEKPTHLIDLNVFETKNISAEPTTPTKKIPQPFFVKKTPPSSKKKNSAENTPNTTPTKASKSLLDAFEVLPSTSSEKQPINERETIAMAADVLRENKTRDELEEIAAQLNQERYDLAAERNKKDRMGVSITEQMSTECMELLRLFGIPYIVAPMEAEAQCAFLNELNLTDGTITDDSDIWLFGGKTVYKNFFDQNKLVMEFKSDTVKRLFHLDRRELIQLAFLVGSDYTQGIHGVGAVTALEVLSIFGTTPEKEGETTAIMSILSSLRKFRDWWHNKNVTQRTAALKSKLKNITLTEDFPNARVVEAYLYPTVDENSEKFTWGHPEVESIREYAKKSFGWTFKKTDEIIIPVMKKLNEKSSQRSIQNYFKITHIDSRHDLKVSKRVRDALSQLSADPESLVNDENDEQDGAVVEKKKPKRKKARKVEGDVESVEKEEESAKDDEKTSKDKHKSTKTVTKTKRKRKTPGDAAVNTDQNDSLNEPSTSATASSACAAKKIVLPDNNCPIPQREKDKEMLEKNKAKAIALLKKMRKN